VIVSVSAVVLLGALVWLLIRYAGLRAWQALVAALFGFFLASTAAAPQIRAAIHGALRILSGH
jgi:uncharacterized membrane protein